MAKSRETGDWTITRTPLGRARRGGGATAAPTVPDQFLQASGVSVADAFEATPPVVGARRGAGAEEHGRPSWSTGRGPATSAGGIRPGPGIGWGRRSRPPLASRVVHETGRDPVWHSEGPQ